MSSELFEYPSGYLSYRSIFLAEPTANRMAPQGPPIKLPEMDFVGVSSGFFPEFVAP